MSKLVSPPFGFYRQPRLQAGDALFCKNYLIKHKVVELKVNWGSWADTRSSCNRLYLSKSKQNIGKGLLISTSGVENYLSSGGSDRPLLERGSVGPAAT